MSNWGVTDPRVRWLSKVTAPERPPMLRIALVSSCLTLPGLLACRSSTAPPAPCDAPIAVTLRYTPSPRFDWSPSCGISSLTVSAVPASPTAESVVWGFTVPEQRPVGPSIAYGANPEGATVWMAPAPLAVGTTYRITVKYTIGGDGVAAQGEATFTWYPAD